MKYAKKWSADVAISFKQWGKVYRSELMDDELPVEEFLEIVEKLTLITPVYLQTTRGISEK